MKPFKYKLNSVLKLRVFEKQKIENQLSILNNEIISIKENMTSIQKSLSELQTNINRAGERGQLDLSLIKYFPEYLNASEREIKNLKNELSEKESQRRETLKKLDEAMAKVKVLENDKENKHSDFKVLQRKKENLELEDMQIILRGRR